SRKHAGGPAHLMTSLAAGEAQRTARAEEDELADELTASARHQRDAHPTAFTGRDPHRESLRARTGRRLPRVTEQGVERALAVIVHGDARLQRFAHPRTRRNATSHR